MYKTLDLKNRRTTKFGCFASYFRLSARRGVKVYNAGEYSDAKYSNAHGVKRKKDVNFDAARGDFDFIQTIECRIVPKVYRLVAVKLKGMWYPGIVMEHVQGVHLDKLQSDKDLLKNTTGEELIHSIHREFKQLTGYIHQDLHGYNIIFQRKTKTYKVIDLTLEFATPSDEYDDDSIPL